jgi:hypothetical protein
MKEEKLIKILEMFERKEIDIDNVIFKIKEIYGGN